MKKNLHSKWWDDLLVTEAVKNASSIAGVIRNLGLAVSGTTYSAAKRHIKRLNLDINHFEPYKDRERRRKANKAKISDKQMFVENSPYGRSSVRARIIKKQLIPYICTKCGNDGLWMNEKLSLQLEHKNGINDDHRLENLEFLCPNCHTQTSTWGSKNGRAQQNHRKYDNRQQYFEAIRQHYIDSQQDNIRKVLNAGVQFGERGWSKQVSEIIGCQPQRVKQWMLKCLPETYENLCLQK